MHLKAPRPLWLLPLLLSLGCKDPDTVAVQNRHQTAQEKLEQGRNLLANGQPELAARVLGQAAGLMPDKTEPLLLQADAHWRSGNSGAAILALKQAMLVNPTETPDIKRKLAERYEQDGHLRQAIDVLMELRDKELLGDLDILRLAHLQTLEGQHEAAFKTLERIQRERPDDVDAKVVEAEILLAKGQEVLAAKLMDRLLTEQPALSTARILRARYFLQSGVSEYAEQDLAQLQGEEAVKPEVLTLKARVLESLDITVEDAEVLAAGTGRPVVVEAPDGTDWLLMSRDVGDDLTAIAGVDLDRDDRLLARLVATQVVVGLVILVLLGSAAYVLVRNSLRPLTEVERTARAIAAGDLSQRVPAGDERTEVGRLSLALNGMLARIERSFRAQQASEEQARASETRMRRFVADASHELRTPLTSIRGFAELYRQGAAGSPEETARLMQRIESEGSRMGVLVEDLLQLARLDQQRPLTITPVDLAEVAGDAVHDARALQPDRPLTLHLDESLSEVPVVLGDEARLRQVVGNLVTNALVHTPRTAPVTVRISDEPAAGDASADGDDGGVVVLQVADQGPGMAPEDAARVTTRVPCGDYFKVRDAALVAHATQVDPEGFWFRVPLEIHQEVWPTEDYQLVHSHVASELPEDDLFAGIRAKH